MAKTEKTAQKRFCDVEIDKDGEISRLSLEKSQLERENILLRIQVQRLTATNERLQRALDNARQGRFGHLRCEECGEILELKGSGRMPKYCSTRCRVRAYRDRGRNEM